MGCRLHALKYVGDDSLHRTTHEYCCRTGLQAAAEAGDLQIVERLLTAKADVDAEVARVSGRTDLQAAAEAGHLGLRCF